MEDLFRFNGTEITYTEVNKEVRKNFEFTNYTARVCIACVFIVISVVGTVGNSLTILAVLLTKKLQNATNTFVINLAVSDLISCLFMPWSIATMLSRYGWPSELGLVCSIAGGVLSVTIGCSFYTLASIALNRLILITYPRHKYHKIFKPSVLTVWVIVIWAIPFSFIILPPLFGVGALGYNPKYKTCSDISEGYHENASQTFDYIQAMGVFPLPLLVLIVSYSRIIYFVWSHSRQFVIKEIPVMVQTPGIVADTTMTSSSDSVESKPGKTRKVTVTMCNSPLDRRNGIEGATRQRSRRLSRRELLVTKNLFIVFCVFMICLLPYVVVLVYDDSDPATPYVVCFLLINSCVNPIIYATRFPNFKLVFKCILKCHWYAIPDQSNLLLRLRRCGCGCCTAPYV